MWFQGAPPEGQPKIGDRGTRDANRETTTAMASPSSTCGSIAEISALAPVVSSAIVECYQRNVVAST
jgi:hypothetical protein